jgi:ABC-type uncharacterized transport system fused permease/ATPase subunit
LGRRTGKGNGESGFLISAVVIFLTSRFLKIIRPPFGKLVKEQAEKEGTLRAVHSRLITNSEEISFYRGDLIEKNILYQSYLSLVKHMNVLFKAKIFYVMMEQFIMKYVWNSVGLILMAIPTFYYERNGKFSVEDVSANEIAQRTG